MFKLTAPPNRCTIATAPAAPVLHARVARPPAEEAENRSHGSPHDGAAEVTVGWLVLARSRRAVANRRVTDDSIYPVHRDGLGNSHTDRGWHDVNSPVRAITGVRAARAVDGADATDIVVRVRYSENHAGFGFPPRSLRCVVCACCTAGSTAMGGRRRRDNSRLLVARVTVAGTAFRSAASVNGRGSVRQVVQNNVVVKQCPMPHPDS